MILRPFFFNDTATTEIYPLSLHDALPILLQALAELELVGRAAVGDRRQLLGQTGDHLAARLALLVLVRREDRKSTRLNSSHANISYAVFCLKNKRRLLLDQDKEPH